MSSTTKSTGLGPKLVECVLPGRRLEHVPAFEAQVEAYQFANVRFVLGDQDAPLWSRPRSR